MGSEFVYFLIDFQKNIDLFRADYSILKILNNLFYFSVLLFYRIVYLIYVRHFFFSKYFTRFFFHPCELSIIELLFQAQKMEL